MSTPNYISPPRTHVSVPNQWSSSSSQWTHLLAPPSGWCWWKLRQWEPAPLGGSERCHSGSPGWRCSGSLHATREQACVYTLRPKQNACHLTNCISNSKCIPWIKVLFCVKFHRNKFPMAQMIIIEHWLIMGCRRAIIWTNDGRPSLMIYIYIYIYAYLDLNELHKVPVISWTFSPESIIGSKSTSQIRRTWYEPTVDALVAGNTTVRPGAHSEFIAYVHSKRAPELQRYKSKCFVEKNTWIHRGIPTTLKFTPEHTTTCILFRNVEGPQWTYVADTLSSAK